PLAANRADRDVSQRHPAREGRADHPLTDLGAGTLGLRPRRCGGGDLGIVIGAGSEAALLERLDAAQLLIGLAQARLRLAQLRALLGLLEDGDYLAALH